MVNDLWCTPSVLPFLLFFYAPAKSTMLYHLSSPGFSNQCLRFGPIRGRNVFIVKCSPSLIPHIFSP